MMHRIDPKTAAHNIATLYSQKFIEQAPNVVLDVTGTEICTSAKQAAYLYQIVYDQVLEVVEDCNNDSDVVD